MVMFSGWVYWNISAVFTAQVEIAVWRPVVLQPSQTARRSCRRSVLGKPGGADRSPLVRAAIPRPRAGVP
jgi:hypothetical protein